MRDGASTPGGAPVPQKDPRRWGSLEPLRQLLLLRIWWLIREPGALFFILLFPVVVTAALGLAFQRKGAPEIPVAVVESAALEGGGMDDLVARLDATEGLRAIRCSATEGERMLRGGRASLVLIPGPSPSLIMDPTSPDSLSARALVSDALERMNGRKDTLEIKQQQSKAVASYVHFLVPGTLAFAIMNSAIWGFAFTIVRMRQSGQLKRLFLTPMPRAYFLTSFLVVKVGVALVEIGVSLLVARLLFGVRVEGSTLTLVGFGVGGALSFTGLALMAASRSANADVSTAIGNIIVLPMTLLSGVFFPSTHFPDVLQPLIQVLPLTALIGGLRAIMLDGASAAALGSQALILLCWGGISFVLAIKLFRWS